MKGSCRRIGWDKTSGEHHYGCAVIVPGYAECARPQRPLQKRSPEANKAHAGKRPRQAVPEGRKAAPPKGRQLKGSSWKAVGG